MRVRLRLVAAFTVALGAMAGSGLAQDAQTAPASPTPQTPQAPQLPDSQQQPTFRTGVDVVTVDVAVVDGRGNPVEDSARTRLRREDRRARCGASSRRS